VIIDRLGPRIVFTFEDAEHPEEDITILLHPRDVLGLKERDHEGYKGLVSLVKVRGEPQPMILPLEKELLMKLLLLAEQHPSPRAFAKAVAPYLTPNRRSPGPRRP